ncbi:MAG TPA: hypothetical protein VKR32_19645, partial [Puia sp.]|nr:hypothetical protein [Puia sp.]
MDEAKIQLSEEEMVLVRNGEWILTKNRIIQKVYQLFGSLASTMTDELEESRLPHELRRTPPKISKGENYRGFPYVVLDCPRNFSKNDIFAIRTFFWWAHYFSVTLHLKGTFRDRLQDNILANRQLLSTQNFCLVTAHNEWEHDLAAAGPISFRELTKADLEKRFSELPFLKITSVLELKDWNVSAEGLARIC